MGVGMKILFVVWALLWFIHADCIESLVKELREERRRDKTKDDD